MTRCVWLPPPRELDPRGRVLFVCETCGNPVAVPASVAHLPVRRSCGASVERTPRPPVPTDGPGSELERLIAELGLSKFQGCGCKALRAAMNAGGAEFVEAHRPEIIERLKAAAAKAGWGEWARAGVKAAWGGWLRIAEPEASLLDESLRRWAAKASA